MSTSTVTPRVTALDSLQLLERTAERDALAGLIASARAGHGAALLIEGPAGIGKTRLIREATLLGGERCRLLLGRGSELERDFPFGVVRQLFEPVLGRLSPDKQDAVFAGVASQASGIFAPDSAPTPLAADEGYRLLHGLYWMAVNLAELEPVVLCIDDAHWADELSLRWLAHLVNRLDGVPIALVAALRPSDPDVDQTLLARIEAHPATSVLRPRRLSSVAVGELTAAAMDAAPQPGFVTACAEATQGNPFFLSELLRALTAKRVAPTDANAHLIVELAMPSVSQALLQRFSSLSAEALALARALVTLGPEPRPEPAGELAALDPGGAARASAELVEAAVLEPGGQDFLHPLLRAAIYDAVPATERLRLHDRAAHVLHNAGSPAEQVAHQLMLSAPSGQPWAAAVLVEAATLGTARGAPATAARFLERALAEGAQETDRVETLWRLGIAELASGGDGLRHLRRAHEQSNDPDTRAEILLDTGRVLFERGLFSEAAQTLEDALDLAPDDASPVARRLRAALANIALTSLDVQQRLGGLVEVGRTARAHATEDPVSAATLAWVTAATAPAKPHVIDLATSAMNDPSARRDATVAASALSAVMAAGDLEGARAGWDHVVSDARGNGDTGALTFGLSLRAPVHLRLGDVRGAEADTREVIDLLVETGVDPADRRDSAPWLLCPLIETLVELGELDQADDFFTLAGLDDEFPQLLQYTYLLRAVGLLRFAQGRAPEAVDLLRECGRRQSSWGITSPGFCSWRPDLAVASAALGHPAEATELCVQETELARSFGLARELGMALRADGLIRGDDQGAARLREAVAILEDSPATLEASRALVDLGALERRLGHRREAREHLRRGSDLAHRCGANGIAKTALDELTAAGAKPRRLAFSGLESLTASELRVSRIAAQGLSNRDIAQALFVTEKTVEGHLANAYRKLDIRSRTQLVDALSAPDAPAHR
jgi:DNA-binding CsgD family transcriptional regulator